MGKEKKKSNKSAIKKLFKVITFKRILIIALIVVAMVGGAFINETFFTKSTTHKLNFEDIGELSTQAAYVNEINVTQDARTLFGMEIPFTQSKVIFSYNVVVKAGYDFSEITYTVNDNSKVIKVKLPEVKILSCELDPDSFENYHEEDSIFTPFTVDKYNAAVSDLTKKAQEDAVDNGLLEAAEENGKVIISNFFYQTFDKDEYTIEYI